MDTSSLLILAGNGDASAQNELGIAYMTGENLEKDEQKAVRWFQRAASQGNPEAVMNLGMCHLLGRGVTKDIGAALFVLESAFLMGESDCIIHIITAIKNDAVSIEELQKLSNENDMRAAWVLGICYDHGIRIDVDHHRALELFCASAACDNPIALWLVACFVANQEQPDLQYAVVCLEKMEQIVKEQVGCLANQQIERSVAEIKEKLRNQSKIFLLKVIPECTEKDWPKDKYVQDLLDGKLYMKSLDQFGDFIKRDESSDNDFRGDPLEGYSDGLIDVLTLRKKVYCLSALDYYEPCHTLISPSPKMKQFGEYAVIIHDVKEFLNRVHTALTKYMQNDNAQYRLSYGRVAYDVELTRGKRYDEFHKLNSYSWQNEFRISMDFSEGRFSSVMLDEITDYAKLCFPGRIEIDENHLSLSDWIYFEIGDIRDICQYVEVDALLKGDFSIDLKNEPVMVEPYGISHPPRPTFCKGVMIVENLETGTHHFAVTKNVIGATTL